LRSAPGSRLWRRAPRRAPRPRAAPPCGSLAVAARGRRSRPVRRGRRRARRAERAWSCRHPEALRGRASGGPAATRRSRGAADRSAGAASRGTTSVERKGVICRTLVALAPLTTLRVGGAAAELVDVEREADVIDAVRTVEARGLPPFVLGEGSNVVVGDGGFPGLVARPGTRGVEARREGDRVVVDVAAGEPWDAFVARTVDEGWRGLECLSGIPGLVGGTPIQNVGAYGQEVAETITRVRVYDRVAGAFADLARRDCRFGYRASLFKRSDRWIVTSVRFELEVSPLSSPLRYAELVSALGIEAGGRVP